MAVNPEELYDPIPLDGSGRLSLCYPNQGTKQLGYLATNAVSCWSGLHCPYELLALLLDLCWAQLFGQKSLWKESQVLPVGMYRNGVWCWDQNETLKAPTMDVLTIMWYWFNKMVFTLLPYLLSHWENSKSPSLAGPFIYTCESSDPLAVQRPCGSLGG